MSVKQTYFAQVQRGIVVDVIIADQEFINSGLAGDFNEFIETCPDTFANTHPEGTPLRKNYAGIGWSYDPNRDAFIPPQTFASWTLNEDTCQWDPPIPRPNPDVLELEYIWSEEKFNWLCLQPEDYQKTILNPNDEPGKICQIYPWAYSYTIPSQQS